MKNSVVMLFFGFVGLMGVDLLALTTVQTSTSLGYYRDYTQVSRFPVYHSWSLHGIYDQGLESSLSFLLSNDFSVNRWSVLPTQAELDIPWGPLYGGASQNSSKLRLGRQSFLEGFDYAILDGVQAPVLWSTSGGLMPVAGSLRANDIDQDLSSSSPLVGLVAWESFFDVRFRTGYMARGASEEGVAGKVGEEALGTRHFFLGGVRQFPSLYLSPQLLLKQEWNADTMNFNQFSGDLSVALGPSWNASFGYDNLEPRPIQKKNIASFIYRIFSISPSESVRFNTTVEASSRLRYSASETRVFYDSGKGREISDRQDLSLDYSWSSGHWLTPIVTHMTTYGGHIYDQGLRYTYDISDRAQYSLEYDFGWLSKVNGIEGWVQHLRTGYETQIAERAKVLLNLEAERNQYFEFDVRTMAYVTNYL